MTVDIRIAEPGPGDAADWAMLRAALWPDDHRQEVAEALVMPNADTLVLLAFAGIEAIGMIEAAIRRDYVNGCDTSPVLFAEGLYVVEAWRRQGIARRLIEAVAVWGRKRGLCEFASDAPADNRDSRAMHAALGFAETETVVFFRRSIA